MFGERPKFDDASGKVKIIIRIEQGLLGATEVLEYFQNKHPNMLIKDIDLHILSIAWDELYESDDDDQKAGEYLGAITEQYNEQWHSLYGNDIYPVVTEAGDIQGKESNAANGQEDDVAEEVQGDEEDAWQG